MKRRAVGCTSAIRGEPARFRSLHDHGTLGRESADRERNGCRAGIDGGGDRGVDLEDSGWKRRGVASVEDLGGLVADGQGWCVYWS